MSDALSVQLVVTPAVAFAVEYTDLIDPVVFFASGLLRPVLFIGLVGFVVGIMLIRVIVQLRFRVRLSGHTFAVLSHSAAPFFTARPVLHEKLPVTENHL